MGGTRTTERKGTEREQIREGERGDRKEGGRDGWAKAVLGVGGRPIKMEGSR